MNTEYDSLADLRRFVSDLAERIGNLAERIAALEEALEDLAASRKPFDREGRK